MSFAESNFWRITSVEPYHSTSTTANWPMVPMMPPKAPYASAFFAPSRNVFCTLSA